MTTYPSHAIQGTTLATVDAVASDWRADRDWRVFENACRIVARANGGDVDPNLVRAELTDEWGDLAIRSPRRYSSFWHRASGKAGFLVAAGWVLNDDVKAGNGGKPLRRYSLKAAA